MRQRSSSSLHPRLPDGIGQGSQIGLAIDPWPSGDLVESRRGVLMSTISRSLASTVPTKYWHTLDDGRVQCDLCPRFCKLHEGQRGFCFVRACEGGQVVLTTYGRSSGF